MGVTTGIKKRYISRGSEGHTSIHRLIKILTDMASIFGAIATETPKYSILSKLANRVEIRCDYSHKG